MPHAGRIALLLSFIAVFAAFWVSENVYERIPHVEDEFAYMWQAQVFAQGQAAIASPSHPKLLVVPFVVDDHGLRFGKYPPGWPLFLALGVLTGMTSWINPILAGMGTWFTFRLGQTVFDDRIGLLAAGLMLTSPFFLLNSGTLLSHPWSLFLSLTLTLAWLDLFFEDSKTSIPIIGSQKSPGITPAWIKIGVAGLSLGALALTRPLTAIGVGLPFFIHGLVLLRRSDRTIRGQILIIGLIAASAASILLLWQFVLTGNPTENLYALWWGYDQLGFGNGIGTQASGHNLFWVINNTILSLMAGSRDLFGWGSASWLFIPFGLWAARRNRHIELVMSIPGGLILAYTIYWISPNLYGPRYYYESIFSLCLLTAAGIFWMADRARSPSVPLLTLFLIGYNLFVYLPHRLDSMRNLYGINRAQQTPFLTDEARALTPALVIVHAQEWTECAGLLALQDPWLTTPYIFACDLNSKGEKINPADYPDRRIIHYYPDKMEIFLSPQT